MEAQEALPISVEDYFHLEETGQMRHEYCRGEIFAMTGGSVNHNRLAGNIYGFFFNSLPDRCQAFFADVRLSVAQFDLYTYPDLMVVCGDIQYHRNRQDTLENPLLIVEVLSQSTGDYDRGKKFEFYRSLPSLKEYVLVDQSQYLLEQYVRTEAMDWLFREHRDPKQNLSWLSLELEMPISSIYDRVAF